MEKQRRVFGRLAVFLQYEYGNVTCQLLMRAWNDPNNVVRSPPITIPIYYTKLVADSFDTIPTSISKQLFNFLPIENEQEQQRRRRA
jgi:hypothetical protein